MLDKWLISWDKICRELEDIIHHWNVLSLETRSLKTQFEVVKWQQYKLRGKLEKALLISKTKASHIQKSAHKPSKTEKYNLTTEIAYSNDFKEQVGDIIRILNPNSNEENRGTIVSFLKNRYAKIHTNTQTTHCSIKSIVIIGGWGSYLRWGTVACNRPEALYAGDNSHYCHYDCAQPCRRILPNCQ